MVRLPLAMVPNREGGSDARDFRRAVWALTSALVLFIALAFGLAALGGTDYLQRKTDIGTLNGRFQIWDVTLQAWRENVLFGYGPDIWSPERRFRLNMFNVGQAHNQFVQTLGEAGLAGLLLLVVYLITLLSIALRRFVASRGLILSLLVLLLARCVTESPLRSEGLLSWATFLHLLLVLVACHYLRQPARAPTAAAASLLRRRSGVASEAGSAPSSSGRPLMRSTA